MNIKIEPELAEFGVGLHVGALSYRVLLAEEDPALTEAIAKGAEQRRQELLGEAASSDPTIARIRQAFKKFGKDPSRYRPSSEALTRRVLTGQSLPVINTGVDVANSVSLMTGLPVGLYDADCLSGDVYLRCAGEGATYEGVGRGAINLEGLITLQDDIGPFGSPFSDSLRTAVKASTKKIHFVIYGLNVEACEVEAAAELAEQLLGHFCAAEPLIDGAA